MKYVAFFRGINVGGKNKVKMADLRQLFADCGFQEVKTYIQSGNVIFTSDQSETVLREMIAQAFTERFGFQSTVILRSAAELTAITADFPFTEAEIAQANAAAPEVEHMYIYFANEALDTAALDKICQDYEGPDQLRAGERELYLLCQESVRNSKLATALTKLPVPLTARNQKTLRKIHELLTQ